MEIYRVILVIFFLALSGCSANKASVSTSTSPIDGKTRTVIRSPALSMSYIYPVSGEGTGVHISGGSVTDKLVASIVFEASGSSGIRKAFFKADGIGYELAATNTPSDFEVNEYGIKVINEFIIRCNSLTEIATSKEVYLRLTYANGFVDYNVSNLKNGVDGFDMIKKIASYCQ